MKKELLIGIAYVLIAIFLLATWGGYLIPEWASQSETFKSLRAVCNASGEELKEARAVMRSKGRPGMLYLLQELITKPTEIASAVKRKDNETGKEFELRGSATRVELASLVLEVVEDLRDEDSAFKPGKVYAGHEPLKGDIGVMELWRGRDDAIVIWQMVTLLSLLGDPAEKGTEIFAMEDAAAEHLVQSLITIGDGAVTGLSIQLAREKVDPVMAVATKTQTKSEREAQLDRMNRQARLRCAKALGQIATRRAIEKLRQNRLADDPIVAQAVKTALAEAYELNPGAREQ